MPWKAEVNQSSTCHQGLCMCPDITYTIYSESNLFRSGYYHVLYHEALFLDDVRARSYWVYWSGDKQDCTSQKRDIKHLTYVNHFAKLSFL